MSERTEELQGKIEDENDPDDIMMNIREVFSDTEIVPDAGNYYTFVYNAKTPGVYDEFPLVAVTFVDRWGFQGLNFHWGTSRNYTWNELAGQLYFVQNNELDDLLAIPYAKFLLNQP